MTELILSNIFFSILGFPSIFLISVVTFYVIEKKIVTLHIKKNASIQFYSILKCLLKKIFYINNKVNAIIVIT